MLENNDYLENYTLKFIKLNNEVLQHWYVYLNLNAISDKKVDGINVGEEFNNFVQEEKDDNEVIIIITIGKLRGFFFINWL